MIVRFFIFLLFARAFLGASGDVCAQAAADAGHVRSSPAYSEILLKKTELQADLITYLADYTEENPRIIDLRFEIAALKKETARVLAVHASEAERLTLALGKLIVKKAELETTHARLTRTYSAEHPEVKRAKRRLDVFDSAIKEILR